MDSIQIEDGYYIELKFYILDKQLIVELLRLTRKLNSK